MSLEQNLSKVLNWIPFEKYKEYFCSIEAKSVIKYLEDNPEKINWIQLSSNPLAIHLIENNLDKISWRLLSCNPAAIHSFATDRRSLLEANPDKIDWECLFFNPSIIKFI